MNTETSEKPLNDQYTSISSYCSIEDPSQSFPRTDSISVLNEDDFIKLSKWRSIRVLYLTMFISSTAFTICIPAIWPYLQAVDPNASETFLGWVVAAYSIGQFLASPLFGLMYNKTGSARMALMASISIIIIGNIVYIEVASFPIKYRGWVLFISRILIGFGGGNVAVCRSYLSSVTTLEERTSANAIMSASQTLGFILGPAFQTAFAPLKYPGPVEIPGLHINFYTATGFFGALASTLNVIILATCFKDFQLHHYSSERPIVSQTSINALPSNQNTSAEQENISSSHNHSNTEAYANSVNDSLVSVQASNQSNNRDYVASVTLIFVFFVVLFVFTLLETIATPLTMDEYAWSKEQASIYIGIAMAVCGVLSLIVLIGMKFVSKWIPEPLLLILSFIFILCGYIIMLPLSNQPLIITMMDVRTPSSSLSPPINSSTAPPLSTQGCNALNKPWCLHESQILLYQFIIGLSLISLGYPASNLFTYTTYSKVLGSASQGLWMGWLTASGSLARIVGPLFVTFIYTHYGPLWTFSAISALVFVTIIIVLTIYKRLHR